MQITGSSFSLHPASNDAATVASPAQAPAAKAHDFSFGDFLDIINPLQHLPVVGTLYRAITGDKIKTPEKLAGDTLYGGPLGLVSSLADVAFESATGKNFGDTVLSLFSRHHDEKPAAVAEQPAPSAPVRSAQSSDPDTAALTASLNRVGADAETSQRALYAYRRSFAGASPSAFASY